MKKIILFTFLIIFSLSAFSITHDSKSKSANTAIPEKKENKMSDEEANSMTKRVEKVRGSDKTDQTVIVQEGRNGRRGHMDNGYHHGHGGVIFVGGGSVILLIVLLIILV